MTGFRSHQVRDGLSVLLAILLGTACKSTNASQTLDSHAAENATAGSAKADTVVTTGSKPTIVFHWTSNSCCPGGQQHYMVTDRPSDYLKDRLAATLQQVSQHGAVVDDDHIVGPGVYFADGPLVSAGFGDALVIAYAKPGENVADVSPADTALNSLLNDATVPALTYPYAGQAVAKAVVVRDPAFIDWDMGVVAIQAKDPVVDAQYLSDMQNDLPPPPDMAAPIQTWVAGLTPYINPIQAYTYDDLNFTLIGIDQTDPDQLSDDVITRMVCLDISGSSTLAAFAGKIVDPTWECRGSGSCMGMLGTAIQTGQAPSKLTLAHALQLAKAIKVIPGDVTPGSFGELRTVVLSQWRSLLKTKFPNFIATMAGLFQLSAAQSISQWH